jgi:hypothetical protein
VSHILTVWSYDADANRVESREKATAVMSPLWLSSSVCGYSPSLASQILIVRSHDADISCVESREKATELILLEWPLNACRYAPLLASQIVSIRSDAEREPSRVI